jgi:3-deoxy-D-manno-octulosonate 8-phosphate phosphatase (KDO 8-P phosphatase)
LDYLGNNTSKIAEYFTSRGGVFLTDPSDLASRLETMRGLIFDWDGVFNNGVKGAGLASTYSEADSMGTNMLRYGLWLSNNSLPITAIITGETNNSARFLAEREHFNAIYQASGNKRKVIQEVSKKYGLATKNLVCIFDDINDLGMASVCGIRIMVRQRSAPLLQNFVVEEGLVDYMTAAESGEQAVRETSEMLLGLMGSFDVVVRSRMAMDERYQKYFKERQAITTIFN